MLFQIIFSLDMTIKFKIQLTSGKKNKKIKEAHNNDLLSELTYEVNEAVKTNIRIVTIKVAK
ncbi:hypothetical protein [Mycoplasma sp. 2634B]|uniref:hypothetical protein n=2 Tax=unclassified Mycoplasma TaxID=2683645 RepID=UPI003AADF7C6